MVQFKYWFIFSKDTLVRNHYSSHPCAELKQFQWFPKNVIFSSFKNTDNIELWQRCREIGALIYCWWVTGPVILEKSSEVPHKLKYSLTLQLCNYTPEYLCLRNEKLIFTQKSVHEYS